MKKAGIAALVIIVIALGSWQIYRSRSNTNTPPTSTAKSNLSGTLDVSNRGLTIVDASIYDQTGITTLNLSHNSIQTLPSQMGRLTNLRVLNLSYNKLDGSLIGEVRLMPLRTLDVSYNDMTGMPAEIGQLHQLVTLDYSYNKLTALPKELTNLKPSLKTLNLAGNPLSLPTIAKLREALPNTNIIF